MYFATSLLIHIMLKYILLFCTSFIFSELISQELYLKSGVYNIRDINEAEMVASKTAPVGGQYFKILVFDKLPSNADKEVLKEEGVTLLEYLPKNAFYASINSEVSSIAKSSHKISRIIDVDYRYKLSKELSVEDYPQWAFLSENTIELEARYFASLTKNEALNAIGNSFIVRNIDEKQHIITLEVPINRLEELYQISAFQYFQTPDPEGEPENLPGRTSHRSNSLNTNLENGLKYRGDGFRVMMQDDGKIGPHIDFKGRTDHSGCNQCSDSPDDNHGDHVGGTIMGAGNLDPQARGMADGVELLVYNSSNANYSFVPDLYEDGVFITSKSYSNGCNAGYTNLTRSLDQQVREHPSLIHVFSAGNSGAEDCGYGAGSGWGNVTGGHKTGKNVIAVGNLSNTHVLATSSSRGPTTDGRIKPDICGVGVNVYSTIYNNQYASFTGTSMSCPGVAGTITQLYDAYLDLNDGEVPHAGLMKGIILNTADDLGNPGPDFKHGWGSINGRRAFEVLNNNTFIFDSIEHTEQKTHTINVPAGLKKLRVMVYWTDFEASTSASVALVNDINTKLIAPDASEYDPWVLDHSPNEASLDADAIRGEDNLNNMEQITLDNPEEGEYTLTVDGFNIPEGPQEYHVIYYFEDEDIVVTYPAGGEGLDPTSNQLIRWDAPEGTASFTVSFSEDDGDTWTSIGTAGSDARHIFWSIPNSTLTGKGRIKVERDGVEGISQEPFSVIRTPTDLDFEWVCPDSLKLTWNNVDGAIGYEVSALGEKYMDSVGYSEETSFVLEIPISDENWFSVKTYGPDNAVGERAIAINSISEQGCTWSDPYAVFNIDCPEAGQLYCFTLEDESINTDESSQVTWYFPGGTPNVTNEVSPEVCFDEPGVYDVAMVVDNGAGVDSIYVEDYIIVKPTTPIPYYDGFEDYSSFTDNDYWTAVNLQGSGTTFQITTETALSGEKSVYLPNFGQGSERFHELISGPIDLSILNSNSDVTFSFRYSYRKRHEDNDEWLRIFINSDCEDTWALRRAIRGNNLSNIVNSSPWVPSTEEDWTTVHMTNVTSSFFTEEFKVKFQFENDNGNHFYLDDINIYEGPPSDEIVLNLSEEEIIDFTVYPNPVQDQLNLSFSQQTGGNSTVLLYDVSGKKIKEHAIQAKTGNNLIMIDTRDVQPGMYMVRLIQGNNSRTKKVIVQ